MTTACSFLVDPESPGLFQCVSRCGRGTWLCGNDLYNRKSHEHRREWLRCTLKLIRGSGRFAQALHANGRLRMPLMDGGQLRGLVGASGSAGCNAGGADGWSLVFHLVAWWDNGSLLKEELRCEMPVSKPELAEFMKLIAPYSTIEARIDNVTPKGIAVLESVQVFTGEDGEINQIRDELLTPVQIDTSRFGVLELDRQSGGYVGEGIWCGAEVALNLSCSNHEAPGAVLAVAEALFSACEDWSARVKEFAADRLLSLKNDNWLDEDDCELSREDFISRMTLNEISIDEGGSFTFWHDDGDLFWGHTIAIGGDIADGLRVADIPG